MILANDRPVAKGEIVIQGDRIGVSITELLRGYQ
jgi:flagellar motor switch protein FliN/FliY